MVFYVCLISFTCGWLVWLNNLDPLLSLISYPFFPIAILGKYLSLARMTNILFKIIYCMDPYSLVFHNWSIHDRLKMNYGMEQLMVKGDAHKLSELLAISVG